MKKSASTSAPLSRRWFLRGLGGATLAIPALPSLLTGSEARAQAAATTKYFLSFTSPYGGIWQPNFYPAMGTPDASRAYAGRTVRKKALLATTAGGVGRLSEVLQGPSGLFTQKLAGKMNVIQGVDFPFDVNHHDGASLGNYGSGDAPNGIGNNLRANPRPTIDQVLASSSSFYPTLQGVTQRSIFATEWGRSSYRYINPANKAAGVEAVPYLHGRQAIWDAVFKDYNSSTTAPRQPILDLVKADYTRLRSNPRLGKLDRDRLDSHLQRVSDIERRQSVSSLCTKPARPVDPGDPQCGQPDNQAAFYQAYQETILAAFDCGLTRVAAIAFNAWNSTFGSTCNSPWHHDVSHMVQTAGGQAQMVAAVRKQFTDVILPFVSRMDSVVDGQGRSMLDKSLVMWVSEHGTCSHGLDSVPVVTFGGAAGAMQTGQHIDLRDMNRPISLSSNDGPATNQRYVGLTVHQLLGSMLQVMGVPKAEWAETNHGGYGYRPPVLDARQNAWGTNEWNAAGDVLPYLTA